VRFVFSSLVPFFVLTCLFFQTEVGGDSQDTDVDKDGSDDEHPTPPPLRDTVRFVFSSLVPFVLFLTCLFFQTEATDSQDTDVDKNGRHDTVRFVFSILGPFV
jgi:hypothetical protein